MASPGWAGSPSFAAPVGVSACPRPPPAATTGCKGRRGLGWPWQHPWAEGPGHLQPCAPWHSRVGIWASGVWPHTLGQGSATGCIGTMGLWTGAELPGEPFEETACPRDSVWGPAAAARWAGGLSWGQGIHAVWGQESPHPQAATEPCGAVLTRSAQPPFPAPDSHGMWGAHRRARRCQSSYSACGLRVSPLSAAVHFSSVPQ